MSPIILNYTSPVKEYSVKTLKKDVVKVLEDVKNSIHALDGDGGITYRKPLSKILEMVEEGSHDLVGIHLNLKDAQKIVNFYKKYSEGGCSSCTKLRKNIINDDKDSFLYCEINEDKINTPKECGYNAGFSPTTKKYYENPCEKHEPRLSKTLDELLKSKK